MEATTELRERYRELARAEGYEPAVLAAPAKPGKPSSPEEAGRLDALARVVRRLKYDHQATLAATAEKVREELAQDEVDRLAEQFQIEDDRP